MDPVNSKILQKKDAVKSDHTPSHQGILTHYSIPTWEFQGTFGEMPFSHWMCNFLRFLYRTFCCELYHKS